MMANATTILSDSRIKNLSWHVVSYGAGSAMQSKGRFSVRGSRVHQQKLTCSGFEGGVQ